LAADLSLALSPHRQMVALLVVNAYSMPDHCLINV
jgi:hypothetical protein